MDVLTCCMQNAASSFYTWERLKEIFTSSQFVAFARGPKTWGLVDFFLPQNQLVALTESTCKRRDIC
jgi:hypothetical protein